MNCAQASLETTLAQLTERDFIDVWTAVVGEVPAAIVERPTMVELLLASLEEPLDTKEPTWRRPRMRENSRDRLRAP